MRKFDHMTVIENLVVIAIAGLAAVAYHQWHIRKG